ncbi:MAG: sugar phosphate isomerase/epimerase [Planctomycetes bacterium]|nr:sugar phosphate isomerase/epimerase [Planctomycetota bacterium]
MIERLAMTSDYMTSRGDPEPYLRRIAEAGFRSIHWCHEWNTDYVYGRTEVLRLRRLLRGLKLQLNDLHGSAGVLRAWGSTVWCQRSAGIDLVRNRVAMTRRLGSDVVVMHLPPGPKAHDTMKSWWRRLRHTLDELRPYARRHRVRLAIENSHDDNMDRIERLFADYGSDYLGLCYDSGHGSVAGNGLDRLEKVKDRLIALHLHDNDGKEDKHWLPFAGTTDWPRLAHIIATSGYTKVAMTMEPNTSNWPIESEAEYLRDAVDAGKRFAAMVTSVRQRRTAKSAKTR